MEGELPFPLYKYHKRMTKDKWRRRGLIWENEAEINALYEHYIYATQCELCQKIFPNTRDRQMEHCHNTGKFRNIVCRRCNALKADRKIQSDNTSGHKGIYWVRCQNVWRFQAYVDGKQKHIKQMNELDELVTFAERWYIENNYHT